MRIWLFYLLSLITLTACENPSRNSIRSCLATGASKSSCLGEPDALTEAKVSKILLSEVTISISSNKEEIIFLESAEDSDPDKSFDCSLTVSEGKRFNYLIKSNSLTLQDGISSLPFKRGEISSFNGLEGNWLMEQNLTEAKVKTELVFRGPEELRIRKTCEIY